MNDADTSDSVNLRNLEVVKRIADQVSARLSTRSLNDRLDEFVLIPPNSDAATINVVVSSPEVIISAGRGLRIEMPPLPESEPVIAQIVRSIAGGGLRERIRGGYVSYQLELEDGESIKGRSTRGLPVGRSRRITYSAYGPSKQG